MLNLSFLDKLDAEQKKWMTLAIAGMVVADGIIDRHELGDLGSVLTHMGDIEKANSLMKMLKNKQIPGLPKIKVKDRALAIQMFLAVVKVGIVDNTLSNKEASYLIYVGAVLGFPKDFIQEVLKWGKQQAEVGRWQMEILKKGIQFDLYDGNLIVEYARKMGVQEFDQ